jgi:tRNA threonylcarbamoyladenosine biosynthesis protein TsaE
VITARTKSPDDTRELAGAMAGLARAGDVVLLAGELGAGKTVFAQGFGRALGIEEPITSPSFTLVRIYPGRVRLVHADVYRLDHLQEVVDLALPELVDEGAVAVVEWGDVAAPALPADYLEVRLEWSEAEDERRVSVGAVGPAWSARQGALAAALGRWGRDAGP